MDYGVSDSSGTDDDLPPTHRNRYQKGPRATANMRSAIVGPGPLPVMHGDMETQIHLIEQEAYYSLIRAFKAQSDTISWEMESLITELRKELRVSDDEHSRILSRVNADETIRRIREWRKSNGHQPGILSTSQPIHDFAPSPTVSASRKKQKTSQSTAPLPMVAPPPIMHPPMPPSSGTLRRGPPPGAKTKKPKSSMQHPSAGVTGRIMIANQGPPGEPAVAPTYDPLSLIGKKVWTRWPDDNNFYEAVITDYNPTEGRHALVYDINTADEAWEWVNLKEISPDDIRWEGEDPGALSRKGGRPGPGRGVKKNMVRGGGPSSGRGRGTTKGGGAKKDIPISQNGVGRKVTGKIQLLHTETLIKEVESVLASSQPDSAEVERAKKILKEHEEALMDAIAKLEDVSDGESDGQEPPRGP